MKFHLGKLLMIVALCCVALACYSAIMEREKRLQTAVQLLQSAEENYLNPSTTSLAFRYLRSIGISETEATLRRLDETGSIRGNLSRKLPFLFSNFPGVESQSADIVYSNGLLFDGFQERHRFAMQSRTLQNIDLKFSDLTFVPDDDLSGTCKFAIGEFEKRRAELPGGDGCFELYVYAQAGKMLGDLLPISSENRVPAHTVPQFLESHSLRWNDLTQRYDSLDLTSSSH